MKRTFALVVAALGLVSANASAFENQHHVGVDPSIDLLKVGGKDTLSVGAGMGAHYTYGLSDMFDLMIEAGYAQVALDEAAGKGIANNRPTGAARAGVGVAYKLDILRWIPYAGAFAEGFAMTGGNLPSPALGMGVGLAAGLDFAATRSFTVGLAFREHLSLTRASDYPTWTSVGLRAEYVFGW